MTEMVTSGSMSGERKRSDGLLGESDHERRRSHQAPPVLHATAPLLDSTITLVSGSRDVATATVVGIGGGVGLTVGSRALCPTTRSTRSGRR